MDVNKKDGIAFFINNLEIIKVFKDEDKKEEVSVTDFISSSRFNLLFDLVPLMGPRRLIPMVKTQYIH